MASTLKHKQLGLSNISNQELRHLNRALSVASIGTMRQRHGAVIVSGGRVVAVGINTYRNDPAVCGNTNPEALSVHAELAAIRAVGLGNSFKGMTMYVARVNSTGKPVLSRPCSSCWTTLNRYGFKAVIHT